MRRLLVLLLGLALCAAVPVSWPRLAAAAERTKAIAGEVVGAAGGPLPGATVTLLRPGSGGRLAPVARAFCADDGTFALPAAVRAGADLLLQVEAPEHVAALLPAAGSDLRVVLEPLATIDGSVRDAGGRALPGVRVCASDASGKVRARATSRWDGTFRLRVPGDASYRLAAARADGAAARKAVPAGATGCELRFPR